MRIILTASAMGAAALFAGSASAQCTEKDGYVFVFSQCQQQEAEGETGLCQHAPDEDPAFIYLVSNVMEDKAETRSSLGSLFYYIAEEQHGVQLQGTSSQCFETKEAAEEHRAKTIERYRESFENVIVKDVVFDED